MATHAQLDARAARLRAGRYFGAHCSVFADALKVVIRAASNGEGEIDAYGEPGQTVNARQHFDVVEQPTDAFGLRTWTHHEGRAGHGIVLTFTEPVAS